jgi:hypothetical protein
MHWKISVGAAVSMAFATSFSLTLLTSSSLLLMLLSSTAFSAIDVTSL